MRRSRVTATLIALPLLVAAGPPVIDNEGHARLSARLLSSNGQSQQLNIESWSWGTGKVAEVTTTGSKQQEMSTGRVTGVATDPAIMKGGKVGQNAAYNGHSSLGASDRASGPAPGPGTLVVRGSFSGCAVGSRYHGMQFSAGGKTYRLQDVKVMSCGNEMTFAYAKVDITS